MAPVGITESLFRLRSGDRAAFDALFNLSYGELRRLARCHVRREQAKDALNATALLHEVWLRLVQQREHTFENRAHFFGAVSRAMRRVLVDDARRRSARKRHGEQVALTAVDQSVRPPCTLQDIIAVDDALAALSTLNERLVRVVECRVFAGFTIPETANALGVSHTTVSEDWRFARAWLHCRLSTGAEPQAA
jgi:RNA polymerase sigma factor (TIGR02999 family)